jgi:serine/threonine-protein kinase 24/25/MST4
MFPHKRITRQSQMTSKGLIVLEHEEVISGLPSGSGSDKLSLAVNMPPVDDTPKRSPIAELLYMRWLEGLRLKWPSLT